MRNQEYCNESRLGTDTKRLSSLSNLTYEPSGHLFSRQRRFSRDLEPAPSVFRLAGVDDRPMFITHERRSHNDFMRRVPGTLPDTCAKCGARLCALHKPASARAKCAICKRLRTGAVQAVRAIPPYPTNVPTAKPTILASSATPLGTLALPDQLAWIDARRVQLLKKQARERAYLDRRAARGTHTATDDAYEADSRLENELLEALDLLEPCSREALLRQLYPLPAETMLAIHPSYSLIRGLNAKIQP